MAYERIVDVFKASPDREVTVKGWIRSVRKNKGFSFLVLNDGSCQRDFQIIIDSSLNNYDEVNSLLTGSSISVTGKVVESQGKGQNLEMQGSSAEILGKTDESYPLQKKGTSLEFLRDVAHLRPRTNLFGAVFRVRHHLALATHQFFNSRGFYYLNSPIISAVDGEGAGEMFRVTTLPTDKANKFDQDYFGKEVSLCVTGQLEGECFAQGMGAIYTFGPTFRAENSNTTRHLAEFWMIEPEVAFMDLEGNGDLAQDYIRALISHVFKHCPDELEALDKYHKFQAKRDKEEFHSHLPLLQNLLEKDFERMTYTKALDVLEKSGKKFEYKAEWGEELQSEHEKFLSEEYIKGPLIVTDYPRDCKAFYMKQNDDGKTVRAMDVLVPGIGEIIGGSQREEDLGKLQARMEELKMETDSYWWYMDLRKFGTAPHSGFGLGFERAVQYITGMKNIRDVIPFPRTPKSCDF